MRLDITQFQADIEDPGILESLARDHTYAVEKLGIFGTPTLVFPDKQSVFLKLSSLPPQDECLAVLEEVSNLAVRRPYILEVKRPEKPAG